RTSPHAPGTPALTPILTAATVLVATGLASTFFLYRFQFPRERRKAGRALFAAMDWGDFIPLVLALLNARGYERGFGGGGTDGEYLLQHRGQDWLLSSRHSRAYAPGTTSIARSEEHTSELQSRENLVCRLLLEKKNNLKYVRTSAVDGQDLQGTGGAGEVLGGVLEVLGDLQAQLARRHDHQRARRAVEGDGAGR